MTPINMITTTAALEQAASRMSGEPLLAWDLEADSMHHYREKVCLLQVSTPTETLVIDPLAGLDLSALAPLLADPAIRKVFHGADYDVRMLHRDFGMTVSNLFDTMIACQFLGEPEVGLAAMLRKRFGVELDKRYQQADWTRRPLPPEMIDYAAKDTTLLPELCRQLEAELRAKGRLAWVLEECELLTGVRMTERGDEPLFLRFKGAARMTPPTLAVLEELLRFREQEAERRDVPPFKILGTETIRELAERKPATATDLAGISGLSPRLVERYGKQLLAVVAKGVKVPAARQPRFPRERRPERNRAQEQRLKALKGWREQTARGLGVSGGVLVNNKTLEGLADLGPASLDELAAGAGLKGWQAEAFGAELLKVCQADG